jgi:hypothetical protein
MYNIGNEKCDVNEEPDLADWCPTFVNGPVTKILKGEK